jgi:hypothetical protein
MIDNKIKNLKTLSVFFTALVFSNVSNALFWDSANDRKMMLTAEGQLVPAQKTSWLERATTYHEELKPTYNPNTQRVEQPNANSFDGVHIDDRSETVKPAWYDKATTYHEDQKRPWNPYDTASKNAPAQMYYDKKEAAEWNKHYGRDNLKPVPYMYGSASLVLRKEVQVSDLELPDVNQISKDVEDSDARMVGMDNVYIRPAGYDSVDNRGALNQMADVRTNYISMSEPVENRQNIESYNNVMIGSPKASDVQAKTKIDEPNANWRDKLQVTVDRSRPGDFDYKTKKEKMAQPFTAIENGDSEGEIIANSGYGSGYNSNNYGVNNYNSYTNTNKVDSYNVENGDTLSEISDKEKIYGDWTLWPLIYDANRNQVQDPDLIQPGQNLDIPRGYNTAEEDDARYRAINRQQPISLYDNR